MSKYLYVFFLLLVNVCHSAEIDWNDNELTWYDYKEGMKKIKNEETKGLLIFYADWCPTCKQYSTLFAEKKVVKVLSQMVLIKVDRESNLELSKQYDFDGEYIPRTFALDTEGKVMGGLYDKSEQYTYFLPSYDSDYLVEFVRRILAR